MQLPPFLALFDALQNSGWPFENIDWDFCCAYLLVLRSNLCKCSFEKCMAGGIYPMNKLRMLKLKPLSSLAICCICDPTDDEDAKFSRSKSRSSRTKTVNSSQKQTFCFFYVPPPFHNKISLFKVLFTFLFFVVDRSCTNGYKDIVQLLLLDPNIELNERNCYGKTAFRIACEKEHNDIVKLLLEHRCMCCWFRM